MTKYYFLVDKNRTYSVGPFLEIKNNDDVFIGQIIRSNEFSMEYTKGDSIYFELYSINSNLNLFDTKCIIHDNLNNLDILNNVSKICVFNGEIDTSSNLLDLQKMGNGFISTILDKTYSLTFSIRNNLIMCPMLKIEY
jgi:hypothetical protein